jgi:hypothetical protein
MTEFGTIRSVTQLELENFGQAFSDAEDVEGGERVPTPAEIRESEMVARLALKDKLEGDDLPSWSDMYHRLLQAGWRWRVAAYAAWASTPKDGRWPRTQEELATQVLGLTSDRAIATWNKKFPMLQQVIGDLSADDLMDARADVFRTLKTMAKTPDYKNVKYTQIYLEMIGAYVPTSKLAAELKRRGITTDDLADMSDDELRVIAGAAMQKIDTPSALAGTSPISKNEMVEEELGGDEE